MSDFDDIQGEIEKRARKDLDKAGKFARKLGRLTDQEFDVVKSRLIAESEARPPDSSPTTDTQLYKLNADGSSTGEVASNSDLYDYLKGVGASDSRNVDMTLSEHMTRERERRAGQGESNG